MSSVEKTLTKEEILSTLEKYKIGRKPLAVLLGWGATTIMQYINCDSIPNNEYAEKLKRIHDDPGYYRELLVEGKNRISPVAFRKSLGAVDSLFAGSPILDCANYALSCMRGLVSRSGSGVQSVRSETRSARSKDKYQQSERRGSGEDCEVGMLRLETVLLWSQIFSIRLYGKPLFDDEFQPGRSGLPYKAAEESYQVLVTLPRGEEGNLSDEAKELISKVNEVFMWYGPTALSALMKAESYRLCGAPGARRRRVVKTETLRRAYSEVFDQAGVKRLKDIETYLQKRIAFIKKNPPE